MAPFRFLGLLSIWKGTLLLYSFVIYYCMGAPSPINNRSLLWFFGIIILLIFWLIPSVILSLSWATQQLTKHARFARPNGRPRSDLANGCYFSIFWTRSVAAATPREAAARRRACFDVMCHKRGWNQDIGNEMTSVDRYHFGGCIIWNSVLYLFYSLSHGHYSQL